MTLKQVDCTDLLRLSIKPDVGPILVQLSENTYFPEGESQNGWIPLEVASIVSLKRQKFTPRNAAFVGCGAALEAIALTHICDLQEIWLTDVHENVCEIAARNLSQNLPDKKSVDISWAVGDLCEPLRDNGPFDLLFENLPNIPFDMINESLKDGVHSASFFDPGNLSLVPKPVQTAGLTLHYRFLEQAAELLSKDGKIISCIGSRLPPNKIIDLICPNEFKAKVIGYGPVTQYEADDLIPEYTKLEKEFDQSFKFFHVSQLFEDLNLNITTKGEALTSELQGLWTKKVGLTATEIHEARLHLTETPSIAHIGACYEFTRK